VNDLAKWAVGAAGTIFIVGALYAADSRWLQRASFDEYLQAQTIADIRKEIRQIDAEIVDIALRLQYENLTPERVAILQAHLRALEAQKADLERQME
jgi:hypothetical protein